MANIDLKRAYDALSGKQTAYTLAWKYYDGDQPLRYSTERLESVFKSLNVRFNQNWCAVVVDSVTDRLRLTGLSAEDKTARETLKQAWVDNRLNLDAADVHQAVEITGEAFIVGWRDDAGNVELYYNDPRMVHVFYKSDNPKVKEFAAKWWDSGAEWRINLYYTDRVEHYVAQSKSMPSSANSFKLESAEPHEFGIIPVFHFRRTRRGYKSELSNVISQQDAVNKLLADMMVSAEFSAFRQRYIISGSDTSDMKNAPGMVWSIPAGDGQGQQTQVGDLQETSLDGYFGAISKLVDAIAVISRTPRYYFESTGAGISGDALVAMEAPLIKKVEQLQENLSPTWQEVGEFILKQSAGMDADVSPVWDRVASVQPAAEATARQINVNAGLPLVTILRWEGKTEDEINQVKKDLKEQQSSKKTLAQAVLDAARINDEQNNDNPVQQPGEGNQNNGLS